MSITPQNIRDAVAGHDDFGHEMRLREIIQSVPDAESTHGGTYLDLVTGKPRQYDFRCILRRDDRALQFAVEGKNLFTYSPVVVCGTMRSTEDAFHEIIESRFGLFTEVNPITKSVDSITDGWDCLTRRVTDSMVYPYGAFTGKSVMRLKPAKDGAGKKADYTTAPDTDVYERWNQALSSSYDLCKSATEYAHGFSRRHYFTATVPVVVVPDDSLWTLNYDKAGVVCSEPSRTDHCPFFVDRRLKVTGWGADQGFSLSHIHFCTLSGFKSWVVSIQASEDLWIQWFPPAVLEQCRAGIRHAS